MIIVLWLACLCYFLDTIAGTLLTCGQDAPPQDSLMGTCFDTNMQTTDGVITHMCYCNTNNCNCNCDSDLCNAVYCNKGDKCTTGDCSSTVIAQSSVVLMVTALALLFKAKW